MRILFVIHTPRASHSAVYLGYKQLAAYLQTRGHRAFILSPQRFRWLRNRDARLLPLLYPWVLNRWLRRYRDRYDVIVFHSYSGWAYHAAPRRGGPRTITSFHGLEPLAYRAIQSGGSLAFRVLHGFIMPRLIALSCRRSTRVTCLNSSEAAFLTRHRWAKPQRLAMMANGVPSEFFAARPRYADRPTRLLFVGQWLRSKGTAQLADAFSTLAREYPDLELHCVGTLADSETVRSSFPPEIRHRVVVRPRLEREDLPDVYRDAHVFVLPSFFEGFSLSLLEAMASGLPIVTTPVGAAPDVLRDEVSALMVPARDSGAIVAAMRRLMDDGRLRQRLGEAATEAARPYAYERVYAQNLGLYEEVTRQSYAEVAL